MLNVSKVEINVAQIFDVPAEEVVGKVVPFSPERTASLLMEYAFPYKDLERVSIGFTAHYWDRYYGTYTNTYLQLEEPAYSLTAEPAIVSSKLPYFLELGIRASASKRFSRAELLLHLDFLNLLNRRDNYYMAQYSIDYTRNDAFAGDYRYYVMQAPLFRFYITGEIRFR